MEKSKIRFREVRKMTDMTQEDVARIVLHVDVSTYRHYESGYTEPSFSQLLTFADYFDVSLDYLLGRDVSSTLEVSSREVKLMRMYIDELDDLVVKVLKRNGITPINYKKNRNKKPE